MYTWEVVGELWPHFILTDTSEEPDAKLSSWALRATRQPSGFYRHPPCAKSSDPNTSEAFRYSEVSAAYSLHVPS